MKIIAEAIKDLANGLGITHPHTNPQFTPLAVEVVKHFLEVERLSKQSKDKLKADLKEAEVKQVKAYMAKEKAGAK